MTNFVEIRKPYLTKINGFKILIKNTIKGDIIIPKKFGKIKKIFLTIF